MEIEAKFTIPNRDTLMRLQRIVRLGTFVPGQQSSKKVYDRYLDTATRSLYRGGYACRLRRWDKQRLVTVKGLGKAESGIHQRVEFEFALPAEAGIDPRTWPAGEGRDLVLSLIGDTPLEDLFTIEQIRHVRELHENERLVAELSIDQVDIRIDEQHQAFCVLEVELAPDGTMDDLQVLVKHLTETWSLAPESHSKFDLGMALLDAAESEGEPDLGRISPVEHTQLAYVAEHGPSPVTQERARLILGWGTGTPVRELVAQLDRSKSWGYRWIARFRAERMDIFSPDLLSPGGPQTVSKADTGDAELDESALPVSQPPSLTARAAKGILPGEVMSEAGRKVLSLHFSRMLKHEPGTRTGKDVEELHDMRVATRRMRAAFQVFAPYFKASEIRPYIAGLRRTARTLGKVRDLDVFVQKAQLYLNTLPPENAHDLDPLLEVWRRQREQARKSMTVYLDSAEYQDFVKTFQDFLNTPGAGARKMKGFPPKPTQVRHVAPRLIYTRWEQVQAFGPVLEGAPVAVLHALRVECKRLRYTLEFFRKVLGPEVKQVIAQVVQLQDHLGDLHDADVANALLSDFLFARRGGVPSERVIAPGVVAYLAVKQRELQTLIETFPRAWKEFNRSEVRNWLALSIAAL